MSLTKWPQVGDIGTVLKVYMVTKTGDLNISTATTKQILLKPPLGATLKTKSASFITDGTDGGLKYTTVSGDLDAAGKWSIQGYAVLADGTEWHSGIGYFQVLPNLA